MEPGQINDKGEEEELSLDKAHEILGDTQISDEELNKIIQSVRIFCKIAYELYAEQQEKASTKIIQSDTDSLDHAA